MSLNRVYRLYTWTDGCGGTLKSRHEGGIPSGEFGC